MNVFAHVVRNEVGRKGTEKEAEASNEDQIVQQSVPMICDSTEVISGHARASPCLECVMLMHLRLSDCASCSSRGALATRRTVAQAPLRSGALSAAIKTARLRETQ